MKSDKVGQPSGVIRVRDPLAQINHGHNANAIESPNPAKVWDRRSVSNQNTASDPSRVLFEVFRDPLVELAKLRKMPPRQREAYFQGLIKTIVSNVDEEQAIRAVKLLESEWGKCPSDKSFIDLVQAI